MNIKIGDKALITTDEWFYAPDGMSYRAVFGTVKAIRSDAETLGVKTNAKSTNWYVEIGNMLVAGCQIHYAVKCNSCNVGAVRDEEIQDGVPMRFLRNSNIYHADQSNDGGLQCHG